MLLRPRQARIRLLPRKFKILSAQPLADAVDGAGPLVAGAVAAAAQVPPLLMAHPLMLPQAFLVAVSRVVLPPLAEHAVAVEVAAHREPAALFSMPMAFHRVGSHRTSA